MSTWLKKEDMEKLGSSFFGTLEALTEDVFLEKFFDLYKQIEETKLQISNVFGEGPKASKTKASRQEVIAYKFHT